MYENSALYEKFPVPECKICGIRTISDYGICTKNKECKKEYRRAKYEAAGGGNVRGMYGGRRGLPDIPELNESGSGEVYLVVSKWMPGIVKIGASRSGTENRIRSSSIPEPEILAVWRENAPWRLEKWLHHQFDEVRIAGTEWFQVHPSDVLAKVAELSTFSEIEKPKKI